MGWLGVVERLVRSHRTAVRLGQLLGRATVTRPWLLVLPLLFGVDGAFLLVRLGRSPALALPGGAVCGTIGFLPVSGAGTTVIRRGDAARLDPDAWCESAEHHA
jgi:hypothetical protein